MTFQSKIGPGSPAYGVLCSDSSTTTEKMMAHLISIFRLFMVFQLVRWLLSDPWNNFIYAMEVNSRYTPVIPHYRVCKIVMTR